MRAVGSVVNVVNPINKIFLSLVSLKRVFHIFNTFNGHIFVGVSAPARNSGSLNFLEKVTVLSF